MSLSRSYRPQTFGDITDQTSIKETLRKQIETGKIGHAYLFSGPRGVGKTTTARIFAKALNCLNLKAGEPCTTCDACVEAQTATAIDLIEMDAASHTGVDLVREAIIEHVRFAPSKRKFKVYILDEAHMLSTAAWNALLKTLEEPPTYAVFILATTEFHKVPATIVSRCQRFDFKRISIPSLVERLQDLAKRESVSLDEEVAKTIAHYADGCVRDAETVFDQLLALGQKKITPDVAGLVLPVSRLPLAAKLLELAGQKDTAAVLQEVGRVEEEGIALLPLFDDLIELARVLLRAAGNEQELQLLKQGDEGRRQAAKLVEVYSIGEIHDMSLLFMERRRDAKQGIDPRFALELALIPIALRLLPHSTSERSSSSSPPKTQTSPPPVQRSDSTSSAPLKSESSPSSNGPLTLSLVQRRWQAFIKAVGEKNASFTFILSVSRVEEVEGTVVKIRFQYPFHRDKLLGDMKNKKMLEVLLGKIVEVETIHLEGLVGEAKEQAQEASVKPTDMVSTILKTFGGQVVDDTADAA